MGAEVLRAAVGEEPLDVAEHAALVEHAGAGAVVTFAGVVRDHDGGRAVRGLDYSAHPTAAAIVAEVAADVAARAQGVRAIAVSHRIGAARHRRRRAGLRRGRRPPREAFTTCAELVDEVKRRLPVWKHQEFADGTDEWVNSA